MATPKYKLSMRDLENKGEIRKLEHDGFTRSEIHKQMYRITEGLSQKDRTKLMQQMYYRGDQGL